MKDLALTRQLDRITEQIERVLVDNNNKAMTWQDISEKSELKNVSWAGWTYAINQMVRDGKVKLVESGDDDLYKLSKFESKKATP